MTAMPSDSLVEERGASPLNKALVFTLCLQVSLSHASFTTFLPIIKPIALSLGVAFSDMKEFVTLYISGYVICSLVFGVLSDYLGQRRCALGATLLYVLATLGLVSTQDLHLIYGLRLVQGMATGVFIITAISGSTIYVPPAARQMMFSLFSAISGLAALILPILGVYLDYSLGWPFIFKLLAGLGLVQFALIWFYLPKNSPDARFDLGRESLFAAIKGGFKNQVFKHAVFLIFSISVFTFGFISIAPFLFTHFFGLGPLKLTVFLLFATLCYLLGASLSLKLKERVELRLLEQLIIYYGLFLLLALSLAYFMVYSHLQQVLIFSYLFIGLVSLYFIPLGVMIPLALAQALNAQAYKGTAASVVEFFRMLGALISVLFIQFIPDAPFLSFMCMLMSTTLLLLVYRLRAPCRRPD